MTIMRLRLASVAGAVLANLAIPAHCAPADRTFIVGNAGSLPAEPKDQARTYFSLPAVQALIARMEKGPLSRAEIERDLSGTDARLDDLVRLKLIRPTARGYVIGFNYFTLADMRRIHAAAELLVPSLIGSYMSHARQFDRIFRHYPVKSVPTKRLATALIAGFALNWDGLERTRAWGFRRPDLVIGPGWQYSFFASEYDPEFSEHGFIWGSSTIFGERDNLADPPVDFAFSSFGDPDSDPRMNFPDLFALPLDTMTADVRVQVERIGPIDEQYMGAMFKRVLGPSRARSIGPMLFALRRSPQSMSDLTKYVVAADRAKTKALIDLLVATEYIRAREDGRYELIAPVFDREDSEMMRQLLLLHRKILRTWLIRVHPKLRAQLVELTAVKQGVAFDSLFTQIWHELFGLATRQLVERQFMEDPYSTARRHKGSVGILWRRELYHFDPG